MKYKAFSNLREKMEQSKALDEKLVIELRKAVRQDAVMLMPYAEMSPGLKQHIKLAKQAWANDGYGLEEWRQA